MVLSRTLCEPCRLSDTLLARILNLSTHASKSSFTPTTEGQPQWGQRGRMAKEKVFSSHAKQHSWSTGTVLCYFTTTTYDSKNTCASSVHSWRRGVKGRLLLLPRNERCALQSKLDLPKTGSAANIRKVCFHSCQSLLVSYLLENLCVTFSKGCQSDRVSGDKGFVVFLVSQCEKLHHVCPYFWQQRTRDLCTADRCVLLCTRSSENRTEQDAKTAAEKLDFEINRSHVFNLC